jgi:nucleotide-binding universal stress UspA family protein
MAKATLTTAVTKPAIADVVVQLTGSEEDRNRLAVASDIGAGFGAHVIGVHLHLLPDILEITDPAQSATIRSLLDASEQKADHDFKALEQQFVTLDVSAELRRCHGFPADAGRTLAGLARGADLFIGTRPYGDPEGQHLIEEEVLFGGGRACLFLPPGGSPHRRFDTIVVAWEDSRETTRAVAEAMPFLRAAKQVRVVHVDSPFQEPGDQDLGLTLAVRHLKRHGVAAESSTVPFVNSTGECIEAYAHQHGADLLVMGAYGHMRVVELVFGGATRYILRHATLPVLMAR